MRPLAYALFTGGLLLAVLCAAKPPPDDDSDFPSTMPLCLLGASIAAVGVVLWRRDLKRSIRTEATSPQTTVAASSPHETLRGVVASVGDLREQLETMSAGRTMPPPEFLVRIDSVLQTGVATLTQQRGSILRQLGLRQGSEILVASAVGERMLNRTWSAVADGHFDEARVSVDEAHSAFQEAEQLFSNLAHNEDLS